MQTQRRRYTWRPSRPDQRDRLYSLPRAQLDGPLPETVSLQEKMPPVYNQGALGACTYNAIPAAIEYDQRVQGFDTPCTPSRLFGYYNERAEEHTIESDSGATLRAGLKVTARYGYCPEALWPYDVARFKEEPPMTAYAAALPNRISDYRAVAQNARTVRGALAAGRPVIIGFSVYESFEYPEVDKTGVVPWPKHDERQLGGHAVLLAGYEDDLVIQGIKGWYLFRNSYGPEWGLEGYGYLSQAMVHHPSLAGDFWLIQSVPKPAAPAPVPAGKDRILDLKVKLGADGSVSLLSAAG
jgi:C1A family cysteine protease